MKSLARILLAVALVCVVCGTAMADTEMLPPGAKVSAVIKGNIATVTITGVAVEYFEFYSYKKPVPLSPIAPGVYEIDLSKGYRFNFKFSGLLYALLTPEMIGHASFIGSGVDLDCSKPECCFKIVA
jgi:hypothetical protein